MDEITFLTELRKSVVKAGGAKTVTLQRDDLKRIGFPKLDAERTPPTDSERNFSAQLQTVPTAALLNHIDKQLSTKPKAPAK